MADTKVLDGFVKSAKEAIDQIAHIASEREARAITLITEKLALEKRLTEIPDAEAIRKQVKEEIMQKLLG